jgi:hypothetical protein
MFALFSFQRPVWHPAPLRFENGTYYLDAHPNDVQTQQDIAAMSTTIAGLTRQIRLLSIEILTFERTAFPTHEPGKAGFGEPFAGDGIYTLNTKSCQVWSNYKALFFDNYPLSLSSTLPALIRINAFPQRRTPDCPSFKLIVS